MKAPDGQPQCARTEGRRLRELGGQSTASCPTAPDVPPGAACLQTSAATVPTTEEGSLHAPARG